MLRALESVDLKNLSIFFVIVFLDEKCTLVLISKSPQIFLVCLKCEWRQGVIVFQHKCYNAFIRFLMWWLVPISIKWNQGENKEIGSCLFLNQCCIIIIIIIIIIELTTGSTIQLNSTWKEVYLEQHMSCLNYVFVYGFRQVLNRSAGRFSFVGALLFCNNLQNHFGALLLGRALLIGTLRYTYSNGKFLKTCNINNLMGALYTST